MPEFDKLSDDEFNSYLCRPVAFLDQVLRSTGLELADDYRQRLVDMDKICMEPVAA